MNVVNFGFGLCKNVGATRNFVNVPPNDAQQDDGSAFSVDLLCIASSQEYPFGPQLFNLFQQTPVTRNTEFVWVMTGCRVYQHVWLFPVPVLPAGHTTMRFTVPAAVLPFFPANERSLPLSH